MDAVHVLPIVYPPVIGLQLHGYLLSILLNYEECLPWFYSNFIQLQWETSGKGNLRFFNGAYYNENVWIDRQRMEKPFLLSNIRDIHHFITDSIYSGHYIHTEMDEFYMPNKKAYQNYHFLHGNLIFGYDLDNKIYHTLGFNKYGLFQKEIISFNDLLSAIEVEETLHKRATNVSLLKKKENRSFDFDMELVFQMTYHYLYSKNSSEIFRLQGNPTESMLYGMDIYKRYETFLSLLRNGDTSYDVRHAHILWEHKKCMLLRLRYMEEKKYIHDVNSLIDAYTYLEHQGLVIRNMMIKFDKIKDLAVLDNISEKIKKMHDMERDILPVFLDKMDEELKRERY